MPPPRSSDPCRPPVAPVDQSGGGLVPRVAADVTHIREPRIKVAIQRDAALRVGVRAKDASVAAVADGMVKSLFCFADML